MRSSVLFCVVLAAVVCAGDDDDRKFAIRKAELHLKLATDTAGYAKVALAETEKRVAAGVVTQQEFAEVQLHAEEATAEAELRALDLAEAKATGKDPDDSIAAPKVGDRDFVSARFEVRLKLATVRAKTARARMERLKKMGTAESLREATAQEEQAGNERHLLRELGDLRRRLLAKEVTAERATLIAEHARARSNQRQLEVEMALAMERMGVARAAFDVGRATQAAMREVEADATRIVTELELAKLEVAYLKKKLN